ncbi:MAG: hypothetical protein JSV23_01355 [Promethearchaeota archaeon]|nr:MAG: hypothetical protein JSV23_01355 [Candidatus Lokiarchaeota archaeon]
MKNFIRKLKNRKCKADEKLIKSFKERKLKDISYYRDRRRGFGCGLGR